MAGERLDSRLQNASDVDQHGQPVYRSNPALDLRKPRFRAVHKASELTLAKAATSPVNPDPLANWSFGHHGSTSSAFSGTTRTFVLVQPALLCGGSRLRVTALLT